MELAPPVPKVPAEVRIEFERYAREMPYLAFDAVTFDRTEHFFVVDDPEVEAEHFRILDEIAAPRYSTDSLAGLLWHADPKVRTLALAALFDREDPSVLPLVMSLVGDDRCTFDGHPKLSDDWLMLTGIGPPELKQRVGKFALAYVEQYCHVSDFSKYWGERHHRKFCAGWFAAALKRASQGISPIGADRDARFAALRKRIDALPSDDAAWTLIYLFGNYDSGGLRLIDERELVRRCRELGREKIVLALKRKIPSDDPDLKHGYYGSLSFLLKNAKELLSPADVDTLLECERRELQTPDFPWQGTAPNYYWFMAAADLQPARAGEFIRSGLSRFSSEYGDFSRAQLIAKLWEVRGEAEADFVVKWFFDERGAEYSHPRPSEAFLERISGGRIADGENRPELRRLVARLVGDRRLENVAPEGLRELGRLVAAWSADPVRARDDFEAFQYDERPYWQKDAATALPDEYGRYVNARAALIRRLRAGVAEFSPEKE